MAIIAAVIAGSGMPIVVNMSANRGTTNSSIAAITSIATDASRIGYAIAARTVLMTCARLRVSVERRSSSSVSLPEDSPAATMWT